MPGIFVETGGVRLEQGSHLVDEGSGSAGADAVHALLDGAVFEIDNLGVLTAKLDRDIGLRRNLLQCGGDSDHFLREGHADAVCERKSARAGDDRVHRDIAARVEGLRNEVAQGRLDIRVVTLVIGEEKVMVRVQKSDLDRGGANIDS